MNGSAAARKWSAGVAALLACLGVAPQVRAQSGPILIGAGGINRSFGGVAVATPLSPVGAFCWNPATLTAFKRSEFEGGVEIVYADSTLASSYPAGVFGPGVPAAPLAGRQVSDSHFSPLPSLGLVYVPDDSPWVFGLGAFAVAGFGVDYAGSNFNPVTTPPPPAGLGFGPIYSDFQVLQIVPAAAYRLTDRLSVSVSPTLDVATLRLDPAIFAPPDDADGDGFGTFPFGSHGRTVYGAGFVVGVYYDAETWAVGASFKSPQWLDKFRFNAADELGRPRTITFNADLPLIASVGASYRGVDRWVFGADVRYIHFNGANGLGDAGFRPDGSLRGVGWDSVFTVGVGAQYAVSDALAVRLGYSWNDDVVPGGQSGVNSASPVILQHLLTAGVSWAVTDDLTLTLAYLHSFENAVSGPLQLPAGSVPGTSITNTVAADALSFGVNVKFGPPRTRRGCEVAAAD